MNEEFFFIGIDPGLNQNLGMTIRQEGKKQFHMEQNNLTELFKSLDSMKEKNIYLVIEDPNQDSPVFGAWEEMWKAVMTYFNTQSKKPLQSVFSGLMSKAQRVGMNKAVGILIQQYCLVNSIPYVTIAPSERNRMKPSMKVLHPEQYLYPTKMTHQQFCLITGYPGTGRKPKEHEMDSATLVDKMTFSKFNLLYSTQVVQREKLAKKLKIKL